MPKFVEWDAASSARKFNDTFNIVSTKDGDLPVYILSADRFTMLVKYADGKNETIVGTPAYEFFQSRWYDSNIGPVFLCRKAVKTYKQGVSRESFSACNANRLEAEINSDLGLILNRDVKINYDKVIEESGPINNMVFFSKTNILYGKELIGVRNRLKCSVLPAFEQELRDSLIHSPFLVEIV